VYGLGGIGKTQLAVEYAYRHRWDYDIIWWITADEPTTLALGYAQLARALGLKFSPETSLEDIRHVTRRVLSDRDDWLLILDSAPDLPSIQNYFPLRPVGNIIVTSRNASWGERVTAQPLPPFSRTEAISFLRKRTGRNDPNEIAKKLAQALGDLPLALEQAAAVIHEAHISFEEYLRRFETHWAELLTQGRRSSEYPDSVAMTWELSFRQVEEVSEASADLLRFCAFLGSERIPRQFLLESSDYVPAPLNAALSNPDQLTDALDPLLHYSLINVNDQGVWLHRLVSGLTRNRLFDDTRQRWASTAVKRMGAAFDFQSGDLATWSRCADLLPMAEAAAKHAEELKVQLVDAANLLDTAGRYLHRTAQFEQAKQVLDRALKIYERTLGAAHPKVSGVANNLGRVLTRLGDHERASKLFERALSIDQVIYGDSDPHVATVVNNYGLAMHARGELETARQQFEWALRVYEDHYGWNNPKTASVLNNLGYVVHQLGDPATARNYFERALQTAEASYGMDHPMIASILCNLGNVRKSLGELNEARTDLERALRIDEKAYGGTHPDVARDLEGLGAVLEATRELEAARECFERALAIDEGIYGASSVHLVRRLNALGRLLRECGDPAAAKTAFDRATAILNETRGKQLEAPNQLPPKQVPTSPEVVIPLVEPGGALP
jgi:tetratricopeptide (TPR) repeat protein